MKNLTITVLAFVFMLTFSIGTSIAKNGNSGKGNAFGKMENAMGNGQMNQMGKMGNKLGIKKRCKRPLFHKFMRCVRKIDVSDETKESMTVLLEEFKLGQEEQNENMKEVLIDYWELLTSPILDEDALAEAEETVVNLKSDDLELKFDLAYEIRNLLTEEELAELSECFDIDQEEEPVEPEVIEESEVVEK